MADRATSGVDIDPGLIERVSGAVRYLFTGKTPSAWFGPAQPLEPIAQEARGRGLDYPVGYNLRQTPRAYEQISFNQLRGLSENCDLLRLVIETRKDQVAALDWEIVPRKNKVTDTIPSADEEVAKALTEFFLQPSREYDWSQWIRVVMEDLLVIDAVAIFPRYTRGGDLYSLDLIDAGTLKRVIDEHGRTPEPPDPAYQQILKGIPAITYHADEINYFMRNPRSHRLYGLSPTEQVVLTVNTAIRKALHQLQYYTEGNIPEALAAVPEGWTTSQIMEFQIYWDSLMMGDTAARRRLTFVPIDPSKMKETRQVDLKDQYDEWLARLICYAFSVSPSMLVRDTNRATAETVQEQAHMEGLVPLLRFLKLRLDHLLRKYVNAGNFEFRWKLEDKIDATAQATVDKVYIELKVVTPEEIRQERFGKAPLTDEEKNKAWPQPVMEPGAEPGAPGSVPPGAGKPPAPANEKQREANEAIEPAEAPTEQAEKLAKAILAKMPNLVIHNNIPAQPAPVVHMGDTYVSPPQVNVGAVEVHADLRPESDSTVAKRVRVDRMAGSSEGEVHSQE